MDVLLTGASGFLGRNFLMHAPPDWRILAVYRSGSEFPAFVSALDRPCIQAASCDLSNREDVATLTQTYGAHWSACVHLAAKVDIPWSIREPEADLVENAAPLLNVLDAITVDRLVYFSSGAVYDGRVGEAPPDTPVSPTLPYAISKLACERYVEFFHSRRASVGRFLNVRFFGAYGPYEAPHKIYTRLVRAFGIERRDEYQLYGSGRNLIDAMYIDDAVDAIYRMLSASHWNRTVNLAGGCPLTIEALAVAVARALDRPDARVTTQGVAHESNEFWGTTREMRELFGFTPVTPLDEGIRRFHRFLEGAQ